MTERPGKGGFLRASLMPEEVLIIIQVHKRGNLLALANANPNII